jgi:putative ABC transport system permease protein
MAMLKLLRRRLRALVRRDVVERELDEELRYHLDRETEKYVASGMDYDAARRQALLVFGGVERTKEEHRDGRGVRLLTDAMSDARYAVRTLVRSPALAGAAILTLALGIGATAAIFSAVNAVVLRPLPFPRSDRLVMLWEKNPDRGWYKQSAAPANMYDWRDRVTSFERVGGYVDFTQRNSLSTEAGPQLVTIVAVAGDLFPALGVQPVRGRWLDARDDFTNGNPTGVISHRLWVTQFRSDPGIVGRTIRLDERRVQVVGVMPSRFAFPSPEIDVWFSMSWDPAIRVAASFRRAHWFRPIARLRDGVTTETAATELEGVMSRLERDYPATNTHMGSGLTDLHEFIIGDTRRPLFIMLGAAGLLLLIACANVGNLLIVRALGRAREVALRLALGAGRGRLVRQWLTESLLLAFVGGTGGLALGTLGTRVLMAMQPAGLLPVTDARMDVTVYVFTLLISAGSAVLFGLAPALRTGHHSPADSMREGSRTAAGGRRLRRWGDGLVVGEIAIALLLTIGAGLLIRSLWQLQRVPPGFEPRGVLAVQLNAPNARYETNAKAVAFYDDLLRRLRATPGVVAVGTSSQLPLSSFGWSSDFSVAGWPSTKWGSEVVHREISGDYFGAMRVPLRAGRTFTPEDRAGAPFAVIINQSLAQKYFPGENPVGKVISFDRVPDSTSVWRTIVGVVGNEHQRSLAAEPRQEFYAPVAQEPRRAMHILVRTNGDPAALGPTVRRAIADADPNLGILSMRPLTAVVAESMARERFFTTLMTVFAGVGLVLAMVGVFGVMAQLVQRRNRELGIRMALGAQATQMRWLVVRRGLGLTAVGLTIGLVASFAATRAMEKLLFSVTPLDPVAFVFVSLLLVLAALGASWLPATRAMRADPAVALRGE